MVSSYNAVYNCTITIGQATSQVSGCIILDDTSGDSPVEEEYAATTIYRVIVPDDAV
jgi:hypothetical protein